MGQGPSFPSAVESVVMKRKAGSFFRVGLAEMNGWRPCMEDSHVMHEQDTWGFFGIFDGHGGSQCASFIARRLEQELEKGPPEKDEDMKALMLRLDAEFLELQVPSGSTGTFALVDKVDVEGKTSLQLRIGNIGDSRVLLGRADGTMVEGTGTDGCLTTDHKPDHPDERERIERTGGTVEDIMGVARVNGDLAVSRSFGDAQYKITGGPSQEDHPVSACPELTRLSCDTSDFLVLVCDGISEGNFPNRDVVRLAAEELRKGGERPDPAAAASSVCRRALLAGSMDNLSCMIVLFGGGVVPGSNVELLPGPLSSAALANATWRSAYAAMAEHAGLTLADAFALRYGALRQKRDGPDWEESDREELGVFGSEPPQDLSDEGRVGWFRQWLSNNPPEEVCDDFMQRVMSHKPDVRKRCVRLAARDEVQPHVEAHPSLKWDDRISDVCGQRGKVVAEDSSDNTVKVEFPDQACTAWLPADALKDIMVEINRPLDQFREEVETNVALAWKDHLAEACGKTLRLCEIDATDHTSQVEVMGTKPMVIWVPSSCLSEVAGSSEESVAPSSESTKDSDLPEPSLKRARKVPA